jgi:hypothetical protein
MEIKKNMVDPDFCEKECCAGRIKGKCLAAYRGKDICAHHNPRLKR